MPEAGRLPGVYNIVTKGDHETVEYQIPVEEFLTRLETDDVPDEVTVVGLTDAYDDDSFIDDLSRTMDRKADDLQHADPKPMIQFVVDGEIHTGNPYNIFHDEGTEPLHAVFGRQIKRRNTAKTWFTVPF